MDLTKLNLNQHTGTNTASNVTEAGVYSVVKLMLGVLQTGESCVRVAEKSTKGASSSETKSYAVLMKLFDEEF